MYDFARQRESITTSMQHQGMLQRIKLGAWNANKTYDLTNASPEELKAIGWGAVPEGDAASWFGTAKSLRNQIKEQLALTEKEGDPERLQKMFDQIRFLQTEMNNSLQIAQALKQVGQPIRRVDLGGMTSLASKGGWMGEQYGQPQYMSELNRIYDTLKNIDDNTREAEKNVWR